MVFVNIFVIKAKLDYGGENILEELSVHLEIVHEMMNYGLS